MFEKRSLAGLLNRAKHTDIPPSAGRLSCRRMDVLISLAGRILTTNAASLTTNEVAATLGKDSQIYILTSECFSLNSIVALQFKKIYA